LAQLAETYADTLDGQWAAQELKEIKAHMGSEG
jgi:hypothetical protein